MNGTKKFSSLRKQINLITLLSVLVIFIMASIFVFQARHLTEEKTSTFVRTMLEQLGDRLDRIGQEMVYIGDSIHTNETLQQYFHAATPLKSMEYGQIFNDFSLSLTNYSTTISHIVLVNTKQGVLSASAQNLVALDQLDSRYDLFSTTNLSSGFYGPAFDTYTNNNLFAYVRPVINTRHGARMNEKLGTCVIFAKVDLLDAALESMRSTPNTVLLLMDDDNRIISSSKVPNGFIAQLPAVNFSDPGNDVFAHGAIIDNVSYLVDTLQVDRLGWRLISFVPEGEITVDLMPLLWLGMLICLIFAIITAVWSVHIHHYITDPLNRLTRFIENDLDDKLQNRINISTNSEMELFCQEINVLLDKVQEMTTANLRVQTRMYELSLAKKRAEFSALRSQINPHFLYNTLDCLCGYGYMLGSNEVVSITNSLSAIMRYCIKGADIVALQDELTNVNMYLEIIRIRFANRFEIHIDVDDALLNASIPRVTLQPVVENAFYHGLEAMTSQGILTISCSRTTAGDCVICVSDNGAGIAQEKLNELKNKLNEKTVQGVLNIPAGHSLALVNIHNRLRTHYGDAYGLDVHCPPEGGTCVTILLPYVPYPTPTNPILEGGSP